MYVRGSFHGKPDDLSETISSLQGLAFKLGSTDDARCLFDAIEYLDEIMDGIDHVE